MFTLKMIKNGSTSVAQFDTVSFTTQGSTEKKDTNIGSLYTSNGETLNNPTPIDLKDSFYVIDKFGNTVMSKKMDVRGVS